MSFDPTGRYLLFDCYNELNKSDGSTLSYWNINLLDIQQNNIQSIFPPQSGGIDVGNPSFSKTSQYLFTFDYLDTQNDLDYVMAADFNTGSVGTVAGHFLRIHLRFWVTQHIQVMIKLLHTILLKFQTVIS